LPFPSLCCLQVSAIQGNASSPLKHLHFAGNVDPEADPKAGARLVPAGSVAQGGQPSGVPGSRGGPATSGGFGLTGGGGMVVGEMRKAEMTLALALNIGRQLAKSHQLKIYS
jgi:hypothetical protein